MFLYFLLQCLYIFRYSIYIFFVFFHGRRGYHDGRGCCDDRDCRDGRGCLGSCCYHGGVLKLGGGSDRLFEASGGLKKEGL